MHSLCLGHLQQVLALGVFDDGDSSHDQFLVEFLACDDIFVRDKLALHSDLKLTAYHPGVKYTLN